MSRNIMETVMGAVVLVIAVIFLIFAYSSARVDTVRGYTLTARFNRVEGTRPGADVTISGIKVGTIVSQNLDPKTYQAVVTMTIADSVKLPVDTVAEISSTGLLGDKRLSLQPGGADEMLKPGATIAYTQSPASLESLLGQFIYSMSQNNQNNKKSDGGQPDAGASPDGAAPPAAGTPPAAGAPAPAAGGASAIDPKSLVPKLDNGGTAKAR